MKHFYKYASIIMILITAIVMVNKKSLSKTHNWTKQSLELEKVNLGKQIYLTSPHNVKVERIIDVVMATDDNYSPHCATVMASILLNSDATSAFRFHILDGGISAKNKAKMCQLQSLRPFDVNFYDMTKYEYDLHEIPLNIPRISIATCYRLLIPEILPKYVDKAIYLDCDVIVEQDLKLLWEEDLSDKILGVIEDDVSIESSKRLGLPGNYFNAGVLIIDMKKLRNINLKEKSLSYLRSNKTIITLQDQDILNGLFYNQCKYLPLNWNCQISVYCIDLNKHFYTQKESEIAKNNPAIIHFTGVGKPWKMTCVHPLKKEYAKYLAYTAFKQQEYQWSLREFLRYVYLKTMLWIIY